MPEPEEPKEPIRGGRFVVAQVYIPGFRAAQVRLASDDVPLKKQEKQDEQ